MILKIENHGPLIVASNYWETEAARAGKLFLSTNAGAFRLLIPPALESLLQEVRTATEVVVSRGPWPEGPRPDALELLFEDGTDSPYAIHLGPESCDRFPLDSDAEKEWVLSCWTSPRRGKPHRAWERPAWYRRVKRLPCLTPREKE